MGEFQDKELEKWLKSLPKIEDHRSPSDIYRQIEWKMKRKKRRSWIISSVASVAALLLLTFLYIPQWLEDNDFAGDYYKTRGKTLRRTKRTVNLQKNPKKKYICIRKNLPRDQWIKREHLTRNQMPAATMKDCIQLFMIQIFPDTKRSSIRFLTKKDKLSFRSPFWQNARRQKQDGTV